MFLINRWLPMFYVFLLCHTPTPFLRCQVVLAEMNSNESEKIAVAGKIIEDSWNDFFIEDDNGTMSNCTVISVNGTNTTICGNYTLRTNDTVIRRDRFKIFPIFAAIIPILVKIAVILIKILKVILMVAKFIWKIGWAAAKVVGKYAFKAAQLALKAGKFIGKYVIKAGKIVLENADTIYGVVDPVMQYYKMQEESKRMAAEEQRMLQEDMALHRQQWKAEEVEELPYEVEEAEWEPQKKPSILLFSDDEEDGMPGWAISMIIITFVALIVAMPTGAFILTNRRKRRRRRGAGGQTTRKSTKRGKTVKPASASRKSTSKAKKSTKSKKSAKSTKSKKA